MLRYKAAPESKKQPQEAEKDEKMGEYRPGCGQQTLRAEGMEGG